MRLSVGVIFGGVPNGKSCAPSRAASTCSSPRPAACSTSSTSARLSLRELEILVLDEADQMLDLGFIHALKRIVALVPPKRQTLFFSATMPRAIKELADRYLTNPAEVSVTPAATTVERVEQSVTFVNQAEKTALLTHLLRNQDVERALVFSRTKHGADKIVRLLEAAGIPANAIHGNKSQAQRERAHRRVPLRRDEGADRDRHCRARDRHPRRQPRRQLRPAGRSRAICPPHRPHRARRSDGHRDRLLLRR